MILALIERIITGGILPNAKKFERKINVMPSASPIFFCKVNRFSDFENCKE